jgi:large subunit ribosomal protein L21
MHGQHGEDLTFTPILVVDDDGKAHVGKELGKATVSAKLVGEHKGDKVKVFKYRQKTGYAKRQGHRQMYTLVEIEDVSLGRRASPKKAEAAPTAKDAAPDPAPEVVPVSEAGPEPEEAGPSSEEDSPEPAEA